MVVVILAILSVAVSGVWMRRLNYSRRCHEETQFVVLLIMDELLWLIAGILVSILALYGLFCGAMNEPSFDEFAFMMLGNFIYYPLLFL